MEEKITMTKAELQVMLNQAAQYGQSKKVVQSERFNVNTLFNEEGKHLKRTVEELQLSSGHFVEERWGIQTEIKEWRVHDQIRKLVLMAFFAKYNTEIPIEKRKQAQQLYSDIAHTFLEVFQESCGI
ncbi:hypothetical protein [Enterococcus sp. 2201sp1_2201st1_B8_2201SCRN_220225]|uniref:hypothetical protein n=1 Tax=unclassified Enterococcus TaxID=2608891 RepID=UPI0034A4E35C